VRVARAVELDGHVLQLDAPGQRQGERLAHERSARIGECPAQRAAHARGAGERRELLQVRRVELERDRVAGAAVSAARAETVFAQA
jgi:hypothetical protein